MEEVWKDAAKNPAAQWSHPVKTPPMPLHVNHNHQADDIPGRGRHTAEPHELEAPHDGGGSHSKSLNGKKIDKETPHNEGKVPYNLSETPHKGHGRIHPPRGRDADRPPRPHGEEGERS